MDSVTVPLIARVNGQDVTVGAIEFSPDADPVPGFSTEALKLAQQSALQPFAGEKGWAFRAGGQDG